MKRESPEKTGRAVSVSSLEEPVAPISSGSPESGSEDSGTLPIEPVRGEPRHIYKTFVFPSRHENARDG
ncbi:MAG TPA: hypothetical protein PKL99_05960, partial [Syntrophales bacterium]|nr:hypothetical protein [Syntrophales bacterium]